MDPHDDLGREPLRQPDQPSRPLHHQVSRLSDDGESQLYDGPGSHQLHGRPSLVSINSLNDFDDAPPTRNQEQTYAQGPGPVWSGSFAYSNNSGSYAPVSDSADGPIRKNSSRSSTRLSYGAAYRNSVPDIAEEDGEAFDMSLLGGAAPMGRAPEYTSIAEEEDDDEFTAEAMPIDVSSTLGVRTAQDDEFLKKLQEQEAQGNLTGGLGKGFVAESRLRDTDLLRKPTVLQRNLSRSLTRRRTTKPMGRAETIKHMGQDEANRRGEVIEVILEEPAGGDLSNMEGPTTLNPDEVGRSNFPAKLQKTQVFYPQPNWKPFSMRWPYLSLLIALSLGLAIMQELLFQRYKSKDNPLLKFHSPDDVKPGIYFAVKFAPTLSAVVYGVLWQFTDFEVRRLEAYYQLSKEGGALASTSINVDYVTSFNFFRPFRALKAGHYAVALSSIGTTLAVSLVPTFAAASVLLSPSRSQRRLDPNGEKLLYFSPIWSRLLTSTLVVCAVMGAGLFYVLQTRRSGLLADVRGIAGLASMAVVSHILMDFKDMDTAKHKDIHQKLKHHRYMLRNSSLAPDDDNGKTLRKSTMHPEDEEEENHLSENPHPLMLRPVGSLTYIAGLLLFVALLPVMLFTGAEVITDRAPWIVTALAVILKLAWNGVETAVRMMEPYYILSKRHAPSKTLTLDYTALPFGYLPLQALFNGHIIMFLVGFGSVMAEFLTILVTGLATVDGQDFLKDYGELKKGEHHDGIDSGQETFASFFVSLGLTVFTLLYMSVVAAIVFLRRRHAFLPRQPNTIASVLGFIHQSKMLYDFVGTAKLSNAEMVRKLENGKTYGLGWFSGRDGQRHCGVDHEELITNYKHGIDFKQGNQPWNETWDVL